ncbi:MAG: hypothetical protein HXY26_09550 [Hydrogenophilaceae bacterium]|nr:hypothetical protein [Hydrogenophilaceae bacterium]
MSRLNLDFAAARNRPSPVGLILLFAGLLTVGWAADTYLDAEAEQAELAGRLAAIRQQAGAGASKKPDAAKQARDTADTVARQRLGLPWAQVMQALHESRGKDIGFLSIEADGRRGQLTLMAEARNYGAMLEFYQRLQDAKGIAAVSLAQHELREVEGARPVGFTLRLRWGQS